ncbi:MAG: hypothetical protein V3569_01585 [Acholeplasmataceae bacterium]|nr:hypothetical protein [Acholeplasmataceae bacterium]
MSLLRKSLMVQFILFIVFFFMGGNVILSVYLRDQMPWLSYLILGLLVLGIVLGFLVYRSKDTRIVKITADEVNWLKYLLYGYFLVYIINMFASSFAPNSQLLVAVITGILLMVIAGIGIIIQIRILRIK